MIFRSYGKIFTTMSEMFLNKLNFIENIEINFLRKKNSKYKTLLYVVEYSNIHMNLDIICVRFHFSRMLFLHIIFQKGRKSGL
jgi:hypothetical protein